MTVIAPILGALVFCLFGWIIKEVGGSPSEQIIAGLLGYTVVFLSFILGRLEKK